MQRTLGYRRTAPADRTKQLHRTTPVFYSTTEPTGTSLEFSPTDNVSSKIGCRLVAASLIRIVEYVLRRNPNRPADHLAAQPDATRHGDLVGIAIHFSVSSSLCFFGCSMQKIKSPSFCAKCHGVFGPESRETNREKKDRQLVVTELARIEITFRTTIFSSSRIGRGYGRDCNADNGRCFQLK